MAKETFISDVRGACTREIRYLWSHPWDLALISWVPAVALTMIWAIFSAGVNTKLPMALVDEDHSAESRHLAIAIDATSASFFSNLGAALFSKKEFDPAVLAYEHAMQLDPEVFERTSRAGVQAQLPSPGDRAYYDYTVAKLYAKMGFSDRSLEYLKKAQEEGYKDLKNVYKDVEFAELRKDKRFAELMTAKTVTLPD